MSNISWAICMIRFSSLKTSQRISMSFAFFWLISLLLFLILINVTYFFIWYKDQEEKSFSSMNQNYQWYIENYTSQSDIEEFKQYLLTQDTIIIPESGELICSPWVQDSIKLDPEVVSNKYFYKQGETIYFIYSKYFPQIWEVKVLFDTTTYINTQIIIIKIGLIFILFVFILQSIAGQYISRWLLKDLKNIWDKLKNIDINSREKHIICDCFPEDDEINVLAQALNDSYDTIDEQTSKLKQFLTDVSHEFKTPLMVMNSRLDVMDKKKKKNMLAQEDVEGFFDLTRKNITKLNGLLQSLFFVSKIEDQSGCLIYTDVDVKAVIQQRILEIWERFSHKNLEYTLDIADDLRYKAEENTFSILLDNLISNAMKFAPDDMIIDVKADQNSFQIWDNGPGISADNKEKIWEKFYRTDTNKEGFWVGLYLVNRIIKIYNWNIEILSPETGGTIFKVDISNKS